MADFDKFFKYVMRNEDATLSGKVTNEPPIIGTDKNPKSPTFGQRIVVEKPKARFGINSHAHPDAAIDGFYEMGTDAALLYAEKVYRYDYWNQIRGDDIADQDVANKFGDLAVNQGVRQATLIFQRATVGKTLVDGVPGPITIAALNSIAPDLLLKMVRTSAQQFYLVLYKSNPDRYTVEDYKSWIARLDA